MRELTRLDVVELLTQKMAKLSADFVAKWTETPKKELLEMLDGKSHFNDKVLRFLRVRKCYITFDESLETRFPTEWMLTSLPGPSHKFLQDSYGNAVSLCKMMTREAESLRPAPQNHPACRLCALLSNRTKP
jgi:hypothetical protein